MSILDQIYELAASTLSAGLLDADSRLFVLYILTTILIAFVIYVKRDKNGYASFLAYVFPKKIYTHSSSALDIKLLFFNRLMAATGLLNTGLIVLVASFTISTLAYVFQTSQLDLEWSTGRFIAMTVLFAIIGDFCTYWIHRIHHEFPALWPFHSLHHSAEVLTPITIYRKHPIYDFLGQIFKSLVNGVAQGIFAYVFLGKVGVIAIGGANLIYFAFNALGSNLRHTHIWVNFWPWLSHILISPAQHQIHHSRAIEHHDKNYGEIFAIWDWAFGTLYVPMERETLEFGLADAEGIAIEQPHTNLKTALLTPITDSFKIISKRMRQLS